MCAESTILLQNAAQTQRHGSEFRAPRWLLLSLVFALTVNPTSGTADGISSLICAKAQTRAKVARNNAPTAEARAQQETVVADELHSQQSHLHSHPHSHRSGLGAQSQCGSRSGLCPSQLHSHFATTTHPTAAFTATGRWHTASCTATPLQPPKAAAKLTATHTASHTRFGVTVRGHNSGPPSQAFKF